eukprot:10271890-Ditylum_brightwellii.AAC.2
MKHNATITHVVIGCPKISQNKYTPWHNAIAKYLYWCLLKDRGRNIPDQWQHHKTLMKKEGKVVKFEDGVEVWWDKTVQVDHAVDAY